MLSRISISNEIYQSRQYSLDLMTELVTCTGYGEGVCEMQNKYILLLQWIRILESYLLQNYDGNGNITDPDVVCLTHDEISELLSKMKVLRGGNRYVHDPWVIADGYWRDLGYWRDAGNVWHDFVPIV